MSTSIRTPLALAAALALALPLAACGSDDAEAPAGPAVTGGAEEATPGADGSDGSEQSSTTAPDEPGATDTDQPGAADGNLNAGAERAIALAEDEVGGTAFELDLEDDGPGQWEVSVAVDDEEHVVYVDLAGEELLRSAQVGPLDREHRAGLDAATISITEAIAIALDEADGIVDDVDLDDENGVLVWEVSIDDVAEVTIDVATGEVLQVDRD